jgi:hypothetical protein
LLKRKVPQFHELPVFVTFRPLGPEFDLRIPVPYPDVLNIVHYQVRQAGIFGITLAVIKRTTQDKKENQENKRENSTGSTFHQNGP